MNRRQFFIRCGELILVLPVAGFLSRCGSKSTPAAGLTVTSGPPSSGTVHYHTFTIPAEILQNPPGDGYTGNDSVVNGHQHLVVLTLAQINLINSGGTVTVTSGNYTTGGAGHTHNYTFKKS